MGKVFSCISSPKRSKSSSSSSENSSSSRNSNSRSKSNYDSGYGGSDNSSNKTTKNDKSGKNEEEKEEEKKNKMILIGAGEAGKSSVFKQLTRARANMYTSEADLMEFKESIHENVIEAMKTIISHCEEVKEYTDENGNYFNVQISDLLEDETERILSIDVDEINSGDAEAMKKVLKDEGFITCLKHLRDQYYIPDGAPYFFENIDRISSSDFKPIFQDVMNCRDRTTGVTHEEFSWPLNGKNVIIDLFDVGGQRGERKVWQKIFTGVTAIIFVMAIHEFNMVCIEDNKTNRFHESLVVFKVLTQSKIFLRKPIFIIFSKPDLLEQKIKSGRNFYLEPPENGVVSFDKYDGDGSFEDVKQYIKKIVLEQVSGENTVITAFKNLVADDLSLTDQINELLSYSN